MVGSRCLHRIFYRVNLRKDFWKYLQRIWNVFLRKKPTLWIKWWDVWPGRIYSRTFVLFILGIQPDIQPSTKDGYPASSLALSRISSMQPSIKAGNPVFSLALKPNSQSSTNAGYPVSSQAPRLDIQYPTYYQGRKSDIQRSTHAEYLVFSLVPQPDIQYPG